MSALFVVSVTILAVLALLGAGFLLGYHSRKVYGLLRPLVEEHDERESVEADVPQIITSSPQLIRSKQPTPEQEEESQVITVKSPRQLRADKDRHLKEDLDKLTGVPN